MTDALLHAFSVPSKSEGDFINLVSAHDSTLVDDQGKEYIDGLASLWLCQIGHGNEKVIGAITDQLHRLETYNIFDPFTHPAAADRRSGTSPRPRPRPPP